MFSLCHMVYLLQKQGGALPNHRQRQRGGREVASQRSHRCIRAPQAVTMLTTHGCIKAETLKCQSDFLAGWSSMGFFPLIGASVRPKP